MPIQARYVVRLAILRPKGATAITEIETHFRRTGEIPDLAVISEPFIALGRGGSGTRLLSLALQEHGVFLGNQLNESEDSIEWVDLIYYLAIKALANELPRPVADSRQQLRIRAEEILAKGQWKTGQPWGWKLPETVLILSEVVQAFPVAKIIHMVRHPLDTCLRRTHITSRMDTPVGDAAILAAYRWLNWDRDPRLDEDYLRNAASWVYQVGQVIHFCRLLGADRYIEVKYEDICDFPQAESDRIGAFLGRPPITTNLDRTIETGRRRRWDTGDERAPVVWAICELTARQLGYRFPDP